MDGKLSHIMQLFNDIFVKNELRYWKDCMQSLKSKGKLCLKG